MTFINFILSAFHDPPTPQADRVWMVTDGRNNWVEGRMQDGYELTYEEIINA